MGVRLEQASATLRHCHRANRQQMGFKEHSYPGQVQATSEQSEEKTQTQEEGERPCNRAVVWVYILCIYVHEKKQNALMRTF